MSKQTPSPWKHFTMEELTCPCGCGRMEMADAFMQRIVAMREEAGFAFIVSSGFRCPAHNEQVSDTGPNGPHTTGHAIDILCRGHESHRLLALAIKHGITGIGVNQKGPSGRFLHFDDLVEDLRPWVWSY